LKILLLITYINESRKKSFLLFFSWDFVPFFFFRILTNGIRRNKKLTESDFMMLSDYPKEDLEEWKVYRQALRDLPTNTEDPENPIWPTPPNA
jgi:hypothetical protein